MVVAESLAAGTPVLAMRRGAMPEVIQDGETGYLCDSVEDMIAATEKLEKLDRRACRRACEQRFSPPVIVDRYLRIYEHVMGARS
jgi:glycosyltransferase involved in cell wall biosynthesis